MAATSVGQIGLDLVVNQDQFKRQMSNIGSLAKKAGAALAAAFAVKKLVAFGKECLELGSDLAEVQNVVDVTFPRMSAQVDQFAKSAAQSFGLSETMAKKFTGTFGAMAKAFGFSEKQAYEMSTTLTGLAGDVASFYNLSQDEAYTKLKSVFTGETESLKDLGVVMTQSALDAYAMANGYGKVTAKMSEAEKVALRYAFVQNQLTAATGDFARTSDSWANQVRIMTLQFDSLKATIGQGLINLFTPIIKVINVVLGKLATLANAFKSFTELLTGNKASEGSGIGAMASDIDAGLSSAADSAGALADNTSGVGDAAKKAAKDMKAPMGFDEINKLSDENTDASSGNPGIGGTGAMTGAAVDFGSLAQGETVLEETDSRFQRLIDRCKELAGLFKKGFEIGFGDSDKKIDSIKEHISGIGQSLKDIFADSAVTTAADRLFDSISENAGKVVGSIASIGLTIADNLVGGIDKYLAKSKDFIKDRLVSMFDATAEIHGLVGDFTVALADIFDVFQGENAKNCTASIIGIFSDGFLGAVDLAIQFGRDILDAITAPIIENKGKIKKALESTLEPLSSVLSTTHDFVKNTFEKISQVYDEYLAPAFERIKDGFSTIFGGALDAYNEYLAPVLDWISDRFSVLVTDYILPLVDAFLDLFGRVTEAVSVFWEFISPFISWLMEKVIAQLAEKIQWLWTKFEFVISAISSLVQGFMEVLSGVIDFIVGVFTGDWDQAWQGIKEIFGGIWDAISGIVTSVWNFIKNTISTAITIVKNTISNILNGIKTLWSGLWTTIKNVVTYIWQGITGGISSALSSIKNAITTVLGAVKDTVTNIFQGIWNVIKKVINCILGGIEGMVNGVIRGVNGIAKVLNKLKVKIPDWVPGIGGGTLGFNLPTWSTISLPRLAQGGYVKPNTPQLAMIGDNKHQGEVVAPEDKMLEMARMAAEMSGAGLIEVLRDILELLRKLDPNVYLDGEKLTNKIVGIINKHTMATGKCEII